MQPLTCKQKRQIHHHDPYVKLTKNIYRPSCWFCFLLCLSDLNAPAVHEHNVDLLVCHLGYAHPLAQIQALFTHHAPHHHRLQ